MSKNPLYLEALAKQKARETGDWSSFDPKGLIYIVGNKELSYYKIGLTHKSSNPDTRFTAIQQGIPFDLNFIKYWFTKYVWAFERLVHYEFREKHIRGEWFRFQDTELQDVTSRIEVLLKETNKDTKKED